MWNSIEDRVGTAGAQSSRSSIGWTTVGKKISEHFRGKKDGKKSPGWNCQYLHRKNAVVLVSVC